MSREFEKKIGIQSYQNIISKLRMNTGLSYVMLDSIIRQFATEMADELAISDIVMIPEMGTFKVIRPDGVKYRVSFRSSVVMNSIYRQGGLEANKVLREQGILPQSAIKKYEKGEL